MANPTPEQASRGDWERPTYEELRRELEENHPKDTRKDVWKRYDDNVKEYYETLLTRWQKAMGNLLVFGGLFAAVLTPFNVEVYTFLQAPPTDSAPFVPPASIVTVNILWFTSLISSLAAAYIALIVQQWLHDLSIGLCGDSREIARRRQHRYNSLTKWRVGIMVLIPSLLLQVALILFLSGLVALLWTVHNVVATVATAFVGALFLFLIVVAWLPLFYRDCSYRSPQTQFLYFITRWILLVVDKLLRRYLGRFTGNEPKVIRLLATWVFRDAMRWPRWMETRTTPIIQHASALDRATAVMAFATTFSDANLQDLRFTLPDLATTEIASAFDVVAETLSQARGSSIDTSLPEGPVYDLQRPLTSALECLLTKRDAEVNEEVFGETCVSLLRRYRVTQASERNRIVGVLGQVTDLANATANELAYNTLLAVLRLRDTGERLTYRSLRYAMLALAVAIDYGFSDHQKSPDYSVVVTRQLESVQGILCCALEALSSDTPLSSTEVRLVCEQVKSLLSRFQDHWANFLDWKNVLAQSMQVDGGSNLRCSLARDILQGLLSTPAFSDICAIPRSCLVLPEELAPTLEGALSIAESVRRDYGGSKRLEVQEMLETYASASLKRFKDAMATHRNKLNSTGTAIVTILPGEQGRDDYHNFYLC